MNNVVSSQNTPENLRKKILTIEFCGKVANLWAKTFFLRSPAFRKNFEQKPFILFFGEHFRIVSLVLGLEHSHPWPQYAFYVLATPKLRQADASPRQETFFHFRT